MIRACRRRRTSRKRNRSFRFRRTPRHCSRQALLCRPRSKPPPQLFPRHHPGLPRWSDDWPDTSPLRTKQSNNPALPHPRRAVRHPRGAVAATDADPVEQGRKFPITPARATAVAASRFFGGQSSDFPHSAPHFNPLAAPPEQSTFRGCRNGLAAKLANRFVGVHALACGPRIWDRANTLKRELQQCVAASSFLHRFSIRPRRRHSPARDTAPRSQVAAQPAFPTANASRRSRVGWQVSLRSAWKWTHV
jgi:hypothetical protein